MSTPAKASRRPTTRPPSPDRERPGQHQATAHDAVTDAYIARLVDTAPPLTRQQRDTLWLLLARPRIGRPACQADEDLSCGVR